MATTYKVYAAVSGETLVSLGDAVAELTWTPDPWNYTIEYQWRVDAINEFGTTTGDVWSFTTLTFDPPVCSWELLPDGSGNGPTDDPPGVVGVDFRWTGVNNMATTGRLVAAAASAFWYEEV